MDPLSLTLAALAFATAIKDLKEVADQIRDSFSKLPENYANARNLMDDVTMMLLQMQETYEEDMVRYNEENMVKYDEGGKVKKSLEALQAKMRSVKDQCAELLPSDADSGRILDRVKLGFKAYRRRNEVEALISTLKKDVEGSIEQYMLLATIRIEIKLQSILNMINPPANDTNIIKPDNRIMVLPPSSSVQLNSSHIPSTIALQDMSTARLIQELKTLDESLQTLCDRWFANSPPVLDIPPLQVSWFLEKPPLSTGTLRRDAFMETIEIHQLLGSPNHTWIHEVGTRLGRLVTYLSELQMHEAIILVNTSRILLWSATATVYPNSTALDYHAAALTDISIAYFDSGDKDQSTDASNEAIGIINLKPDALRTEEIKVLLARNLATKAINDPLSESALEMAQSSVRKLEDILGITAGARKTQVTNGKPSNDDFSNIISDLAKRSTLHGRIFVYATVLFRLSEVQAQHDIPEANHSAKKAFDTVWTLLRIYHGSFKILHLCSSILVHLHSTVLFGMNDAIEARENYIKTNVDILEQLASENPQRYVLDLLSALYAKRQILLKKGNASLKESKAILQEIADLANLTADPRSTLKMRSELEGDYYSQLAKYYFIWGDLQQAIYSAQNAISCYEAVRIYAKQFSISVFHCKCLASTRQYDTALNEGKKALKIWDANESLKQGSNAAIINEYMELLDKMMVILDASADTRALELANGINDSIQSIFRSSGGLLHPTNAQAPHKYASILRKNNLVEKAAKYLQDALKTWDNTYGPSRQGMMGISYLQCLTTILELFKDMCDTDKALLYCHQSLAFAGQYFLTAPEKYQKLQDIFRMNLNSTRIRLLCDAALYTEALKDSNTSVIYASESYKRGLPQALCDRSLCELYLNKPEKAEKTATKVINLCKNELDTRSIKHSDPTLLSLLYASLLTRANALGDIGGRENIQTALNHLQEAKDTLKKYEMAISEEVGNDETSYLALTTLKSRLLFAKGEHEEAGRLITEVIHHDRNLTKIAPRYIPALVQALRYGGILYCTLGSFDKGNAAVIEMAELKRDLADKSPNIARLVKLDESQSTTRGQWKPVQAAKNQLKCLHQGH